MRGTVWAVDVTAGRTSVFVQTGSVTVARGTGDRGQRLGAGDGVDVEANADLKVVRWGEPRVRALMARFGR